MRKFVIILMDTGLFYASLLAMLRIRYDMEFAQQYQLHLIPFGIIAILWFIIFYIANLYDPQTFRNTIHFYSALFQAVAVSAVFSITFFYLIPALGITPKTNLFIFIIIFTGLEILGRWLFNGIVETRFRKRTIIVGTSDQSREVAEFIKRHPQLGYELKEVIDPGTIRTLDDIVRRHIDVIVIGPEAYQMPEIIDAFYHALARNITFYNLSTFYERLTGRVPLGAINQVWFLENISESSKRAYEFTKHIFDLVFGVVFALLSLIVYPFIACAIKLSSPGPLFYTQTRIGRLGAPFRIIKFRTMIPDAEAKTGAMWANENDNRITGVGRFLRRTRLDELPQLWNIIRGEMSLVGPRAERPEFHEMLKKEVPFYEERYLIKPGLSGWAQINFRYGSSVNDSAEKLQYDLYYIKNRSLVLDLGIVLKTIRIALAQSGK